MVDVDKGKLNEIERVIDGVVASERSLNDVYKQFFRHVDGLSTLKTPVDKLEQAMLEDRKVVQDSVRQLHRCLENLAAGKKLSDVESELKTAKTDCRRATEREHDVLVTAVRLLQDELHQLDRDCEKFLDLAAREFDARLDSVK